MGYELRQITDKLKTCFEMLSTVIFFCHCCKITRLTMTASKNNSTARTIQELVIKHFNEYQQGDDDVSLSKKRRGGVTTDASVEARAAVLQNELNALILASNESNNDEDSLDDDLDSPVFQITAAVLQCVDAAMAAEISKDSSDSIDSILQLAACLAAAGNAHLPKALVARAVQFSAVIMERVRTQACKLLGMCVQHLNSSNEEEKTNNDDEDSDSSTWKDECIDVASRAIRSRLTDKSQAVRNAAICACEFFFSEAEIIDVDVDLLDALLWNLSHDPSAANRISALQSIPITEDTANAIIDRVRDVKVKVRVEALNALRSKVSINTLSSEQYAQVVRSTLTDRCVQK